MNTFYRTEGLDVLYAEYKTELSPILNNWKDSGMARVKKGVLFIDEDAFAFIPQFLQDRNSSIKYKVEETPKHIDAKFYEILAEIWRASRIEDLEEETDWDAEEGREICKIDTIDYELKLEGNHVVSFDIKAEGVVKNRDMGDRENPPSYEVEWDEGSLSIERAMVFTGTEEIEFNPVQIAWLSEEIRKKVRLT